jgi:hypothetical protein
VPLGSSRSRDDYGDRRCGPVGRADIEEDRRTLASEMRQRSCGPTRMESAPGEVKDMVSPKSSSVRDMTSYSLLYYPDFQPDAVWLRRVLLLADNVTRIVPSDVELRDPPNLLALQDCIPDCLRRISPQQGDVAIEEENLPRLAKAFSLLARPRGKSPKKKVTILISKDGSQSLVDHVFLHNSKISEAIKEELRRNDLILDGFEKMSGQDGFLVVDEAASDLILSCIAGNISRRTGFDAITDKPIPFALNALNNLGLGRMQDSGVPEGALLASIASLLVPAEVGSLEPVEYRKLREAHAAIRAAFKELTVDLARINRLDHIDDPKNLSVGVDATAREFVKEYEAFRKSRYARGFKKWAPLYVGGLLSTISAAFAPPIAIGMAGASVLIQIVQQKLEVSPENSGRERCFNMLAGVQKDIVRRSRIKRLI